MTREELIQYWIDSSNSNYQSTLNMYNSGEYMWCLFVGQNLEKIEGLRKWLLEEING